VIEHVLRVTIGNGALGRGRLIAHLLRVRVRVRVRVRLRLRVRV
jgi:hypothetical protein